MLTPTVTVTPDPAPGPGARVSRTSGQVGGALVLIELAQAFGWFGSDTWTADQAAQRWPAITGTMLFLIAVGHNVWNWWRARDTARALPGAVTVEAEHGQSAIWFVLLGAAAAVVLLAVLNEIDL